MSQPVVAFLGLGRMGRPMAANLIQDGFPVRVWNRTAGRAEEMAGAETAATPADAARGADIAITMLADDGAVEAVTFGPSGLLEGLPEGGIHVGMSTISVALSRKLEGAHRRAKQGFVAAPVFGRPDAAAARKLWIVPGGDASLRARCEPVFAALGQGNFPMESAEQASLAKLAGNFLIAATIEMLGEALALGEKSGIPGPQLLELLSGTLFGSPIVKGYGPKVATTDFLPAGFALPLGLKDVTLAIQAADEFRVPLPLAGLIRTHMIEALARGREEYDWSGFSTVIREAAGLPPVRQTRAAIGL